MLEGLRSQEEVVVGGLVLFCCELGVVVNWPKPGAFNWSKMWELVMFAILKVQALQILNQGRMTDSEENRS